jgi:hypothetical protein
MSLSSLGLATFYFSSHDDLFSFLSLNIFMVFTAALLRPIGGVHTSTTPGLLALLIGLSPG